MSKGFVLGSMALDNDTGLKLFNCSITAGKYDCFNDPNGNNYQVPAGKKLTVVLVMNNSTAANFEMRLVYGTDAKDNDAAAPANVVWILNPLSFITAAYNYFTSLWVLIPANMYPHMVAYSQDQIFNIWAIEESV